MASDSTEETGRPLITVGITCHNAADTVATAIASALSQDWSPLEVLLVDDCSTDNSVAVIEAAIAGEPRARLIRHQRNTGVGGARRTLVEAARGEFIAFFDDDDVSASDRLRAQFERMASYEEAHATTMVLCFADRHVVEAGATVPSHVALAIGRSHPEPQGPMVADHFLSIGARFPYAWGLASGCTLMARRSTFLSAGSFDEAFRRFEEIDLGIRAALMGAHFIAVDRPLVTQYKTWSGDKAGTIPLQYALLLRRKHRAYLRRRRAYIASCARAYASFHRNRGHGLRARLYRLAAVMTAPHLLPDKLRRRLASRGR